MTKVKICGITNVRDAYCAVEAGADMLGFVFYAPSARYIAPDQAKEIIADLHASGVTVRTVGVFVDESVRRVREILAECPLEWAQLHGDEPPQTLQDLRPRAFKALRIRNSAEIWAQIARYRAVAKDKEPAFLVDAFHPEHFGGTGQCTDWKLAEQIGREFPILLAGGLSVENVMEAIQQVRPWGVDVSSGVERAPGLKDPEKVRQFVRNAKMTCETCEEEIG